MTRADLDAMPDDGRRHELIDGVLVVTPSPAFRHQFAVGRLYKLLESIASPGLYVMLAPFDIVLADDTVVEPDLAVAPLDDFTEHDLPRAPLLAIEVLSPSTRRLDLSLKKDRYEASGCASYWVVDPNVPSITAWELRDGAYVMAGEASGSESLTLERPFSVTIVPAQLARDVPETKD